MAPEKVLDKIRKLLALGDISKSKTTAAEAEQAMAAAYRIAALHNIDIENLDGGVGIDFTDVVVKETGLRPVEFPFVGRILNEFFFVTVWESVSADDGNQNRRFYQCRIFGTKENVEVATYIYQYLSRSFRSLWNGFSKEWKEAFKVQEKIGFSLGVPAFSKSYEKSFYAGIMHGIVERLRVEKGGVNQENALMVIDNKHREAFQDQHPDTKTYNALAKQKINHMAFQAGFVDSEKINIRKAVGGGNQGQLRG